MFSQKERTFLPAWASNKELTALTAPHACRVAKNVMTIVRVTQTYHLHFELAAGVQGLFDS